MKTAFSVSASLLLCLSLRGQSATPVTSSSITAEPSGTHFNAVSGRPLQNLVLSLTREHGFVLDFEDVPLGVDSFEDTAIPSWRAAHGGKGWMSLKARSFDFHSSLPLGDGLISGSGDMVKQLVDAYNSSGNPDTYQIVNEGSGRLSIVGTAARNQSGSFVSSSPVLNLSVQLDPTHQTIVTALAAIVKQLTSLSGHSVVLGTIPTNLVDRVPCVPPAGNHPARYELGSILNASPVKLAWFFLYDLQADMYVLNIVPPQHYAISATGGRRLVALSNR